MSHQYPNGPDDPNGPDEIIVADGKEYRLTYHVRIRIEERHIERDWIVDVLTSWVARKFDEGNNSMCYFGVIPGLSRFLMVAVSEISPAITTVHPNRNATRFYRRNEYDYFDEVRG